MFCGLANQQRVPTDQTGITACTFLPNLQKMLCTIETTGLTSGVNTQFDFDTYMLEADAPGGAFPGM